MGSRTSPTYDTYRHLLNHPSCPRVRSRIIREPRSSDVNHGAPNICRRAAHSRHSIRTIANPGSFIRVVAAFPRMVRIAALGLHILQRNARRVCSRVNAWKRGRLERDRYQAVQSPRGCGSGPNVACSTGCSGCGGKQSCATHWKSEFSRKEKWGQ